MALFGRKKMEEKEEKVVTPTAPVAILGSGAGSDLSHVLKNPRITEKATMHQATGVYTFDVADSANKQSIARAIASIYKVTPHKIRIVTIMAKQKRNARTGKRGVTRGGKKAYVYLKKGETITLT